MAETSIDINSTPTWCWFFKGGCWECVDFVEWHKKLTASYGLEQANVRFIQEWNKAPFISTGYDCRSFDIAFIQYMKAAGVYDALFTGLGYIAKPFGATTQVTNSLISGVSNTGTILKYAIPALLILLVVAIGFAIFSKTKKVITA